MTDWMLETAEAVKKDAAALEDALADIAEETAAGSEPVNLRCPE